MQSNRARVVFAGGGSAGHLIPGLAVADELAASSPDIRCTFAGTGKPLEARLVAERGYGYLAVPCRPAPRRVWQTVRFVADNFAGFLASRWILREQRVSLVVGLGGYASVPMVRAAIARGLPTVLLEQNAVPGRATRWLASSASVVCSALAEVEPHLKRGVTLKITGNPARREFVQLAERQSAHALGLRRRQLLVLGGSGGAQALNENVPRALYKLAPHLDSWQIVHQTGEGQVRATQELYHKLGVNAVVVSFIDNLAEVMASSDLVVCRAGGTTIAELALAGVAAVLVPYPHAADDHQRANASVLAAAGACRMVEQKDVSGRFDDRLVRVLTPLITEQSARESLAGNLKKFAAPNAAKQVAAIIEQILLPIATRLAA